MPIQNEKFAFTVRDNTTGSPLTGALVELRENSNNYVLTELGTSGFYEIASIPTGKYSVYINSVNSNGTMAVGAGQIAAIGNEIDNIPVSTSDAYEFQTPSGLKLTLELDQVSNVAIPIPTGADTNKIIIVDSNGDYELVDSTAFPDIPTSLLDGAFVLKNSDGSYIITDGVDAAPLQWNSATSEFVVGSQFRFNGPLAVSDSSIINLDDAAGTNHSIYTGTDNLIIQSDGAGGMTLQSTNGIVTSAAVDLNGVTDTQSGQLLATDPTQAQQVATKKYVDDNTGTSFYTQTFVEADLVGREITITHSLNSEDLIINIFDADKKIYLPDEYQIIDANNIKITLNEPVVGINKVVLCADAQSSGGASDISNRIIVNQSNVATTLGGTIDSSKEYFIDGQIDMGTTQIEIPANGISLVGMNFDLSALYSTEDNYTMFVSALGGSGNVLGQDYEIRVTGTNSQVYDLTDATGFNAFEFARVNYSDCTSLGEITNYRQGLENGTGRFGGSPSLTLSGTWLGGYRISTSIVRSMSDTTTEPLFKAGTSFVMNSRFNTDMNVDLGTLQPLLDFAPSNFGTPSLLQLQEMILTRDGVSDPTDTNITPNITQENLESYWKRNVGLSNTYVGGTLVLVGEETTPIAAADTWYQFEGVFLGTGLEHFTGSATGELTHAGISPREFEFSGSLIVEGGANDSVSIRFNKWDNSASTFTPLDYTIQTRTINSLLGARDVAFFDVDVGGTLDQGDYLFLEVRNNSDTTNVTLEGSSYFRVQER